ncbi:alpha/beta hydrolase family protein [Arenimonas sp. MALMAid1274]|uniref:S9 family peptidase n=1 Tax=Arenimonas sp. MALMAid1274 TaxID=3411630 RepID=UPI003BA351F3
MRTSLLILALAFNATLTAPPARAAGVDVAAFVKRDVFRDIKISPTGEYLAATVPMEDRTGLVILQRSDGKKTASFALGKDTHIEEFNWVSNDRVLISPSQSFGQLDKPVLTGELFAVNVDGSRAENLVGFRVENAGAGTRIRPKEAENVFAELVDDLPNEDKHVIVSISPFSAEPYTRAERLDVYTGRRTTAARVPVQRAVFATDNHGVVRFARGAGSDNASKLYYRKDADTEWELINDELKTGRVDSVIGFSPDDRIAYLRSDQRQGPDLIVAYDVASGERKTVLSDDSVDPWLVIRQTGAGRAPVGAVFMDGKPRTEFFDNASADARLYRTLEKAFAGQAVLITSTTRDGKLSLVQTYTDGNPGDFYVFDREALKAEHVISRRDWFDPEQMAQAEPVTLKSRDGLALHGYLTRPRGATGKLPMVVLPHGGPFGIFDTWQFDDEAQMLAQAGYAVLKINFRGSGNYGRAFNQAGARQWGGAMQDDVTDATRWAIAQGIADPSRICIYGASYGAYAALVGAAREPELYRCAAGYVGVYDLPMMHQQDSRDSDSAKTWMNDWVGPINTLQANSAITLAAKVKAPVFMAAGGEDSIAPIEHTERMEKALQRAGVQVETLYYKTEGHGFYTPEHRTEYYTRLLDFLSRHLGGAKAKAP